MKLLIAVILVGCVGMCLGLSDRINRGARGIMAAKCASCEECFSKCGAEDLKAMLGTGCPALHGPGKECKERSLVEGGPTNEVVCKSDYRQIRSKVKKCLRNKDLVEMAQKKECILGLVPGVTVSDECCTAIAPCIADLAACVEAGIEGLSVECRTCQLGCGPS